MSQYNTNFDDSHKKRSVENLSIYPDFDSSNNQSLVGYVALVFIHITGNTFVTGA